MNEQVWFPLRILAKILVVPWLCLGFGLVRGQIFVNCSSLTSQIMNFGKSHGGSTARTTCTRGGRYGIISRSQLPSY